MKRLTTLLVSISVVMLLFGAVSAQEWQARVMLDVSQCELLDGSIVNIAYNAQVGPGVAIEVIDANTYRIYFASDDIPTVLSPGQYDLYYVDFDISTKTCGIAHPIDVICSTFINTGQHDEAPHISACGNYFIYLQLGPGGSHDHEVWIAEKDVSGLWSNPRRMPDLVNSGHDEHAGTLRDGKFYFASNNRDGSGGSFVLWMVDYDPVTNTATNLEKLMFGACPSDDPPPQQSDTTIVHDSLANDSSLDFLWVENGISWNTSDGGYIYGFPNSWSNAIISGVTYDPVDIPVAIFRIYRATNSNHMVGFTDTPPASSNFHYSNLDLGIYIHSSGSIRPTWDVNNYSIWNTNIPVGYFDIRVKLDGNSGTVAIDIDPVVDWDAPESDFDSPYWSTVEHRTIGGPYHIQVNISSEYSLVYDVWATTGTPAVPQPYSPYAVEPCLIPDGSRIYFQSYLLPGAVGSDFYYSERLDCVDGSYIWSDPVRLSDNVNGPLSDVNPTVTEDGNFFFFCANGDPAPSSAHKVLFCELVRPVADILGTVTDVSLGGPASGITVSIYEEIAGEFVFIRDVVTSLDGVYSFVDLNPGTYLVEAIVPVHYNGIPESHPVILSGMDISNVDFDISIKVADISGTVNDLSLGTPAEGISVSLYEEIGGERVLISDEVTMADGNYSFVGLNPGTYIVEPTVPVNYNAVPESYPVILSGMDISNVDFDISIKVADISGMVSDASLGIPANYIPVILHQVVGSEQVLIGEYVTSSDGLYSFADLDPGTYIVEANPLIGYGVSPDSIAVILEGIDISGIDFTLSILNADVSGIASYAPDGEPVGEVVINLFEDVEETLVLVGDTITASDGSYSFVNLEPGTYVVDAVEPFGYVVSPDSHAVTLAGIDTAGVDFSLVAKIADLSGTVTDATAGEPAYGITIAIYKEDGDEHVFIDDVVTSADGSYAFAGLRSGTYVVEIIEPIGYVSSPEDHTRLLDGIDVTEVNFAITALTVTNESRGSGYWKHQVNVVIKGKGHLHESEDDITTIFPALIFDRFYNHSVNPIQIEGVTYAVDGGSVAVLSVVDMQASLSSGKGMITLDKVKKHYFSLLLNVVSLKVGLQVTVSDDGASVSQAVTYIAGLIDSGSEEDLELAKSIAEDINVGVEIASSVIPESTPVIYYGKSSRPTKLALEQNYPNPFNPSTSIMFNMNKSGSHYLAVYDVSGRLVKVLSSGRISGGSHTVRWNGTNGIGASVASGVYFYKLKTGESEIVKKMVLLR